MGPCLHPARTIAQVQMKANVNFFMFSEILMMQRYGFIGAILLSIS